jgi:hypothetical protein
MLRGDAASSAPQIHTPAGPTRHVCRNGALRTAPPHTSPPDQARVPKRRPAHRTSTHQPARPGTCAETAPYAPHLHTPARPTRHVCRNGALRTAPPHTSRPDHSHPDRRRIQPPGQSSRADPAHPALHGAPAHPTATRHPAPGPRRCPVQRLLSAGPLADTPSPSLRAGDLERFTSSIDLNSATSRRQDDTTSRKPDRGCTLSRTRDPRPTTPRPGNRPRNTAKRSRNNGIREHTSIPGHAERAVASESRVSQDAA